MSMLRLITHNQDGPLCPKNDMPMLWCAHCREAEAAQWAQARQRRPVGTEVYHRFLARWPGTCATCEGDYGIGEHIGVTLEEEYVCEGCC